MTNICFVSNFHKTYFFEEVALELKNKDYNIFWLCFERKMLIHLEKKFPSENILLLSRNSIENKPKKIADFKLNELVNGDRFLRHQTDWAYQYLIRIQQPVLNFIKEKKINFIFGEVTHAHEILIHRLVNRFKELNCKYLHPQSVRIPNKRFFFLEDEFQAEIFNDDKIHNDNWEVELETIVAVRPRRVAQVDSDVKKELSVSGKFDRLKRFFTQENISKDLPSVIENRKKRSKIALKEEFNKLTYRFVKTADESILNNKKFVVYTLHMQPEASVDVVGVYYDDQLRNIKNIWRILPDEWYIVIKEHSNAIGNRSYSFFKEFLKLRNSILLNEKVDSHLIIDKAEAIFSVSGTIAYEAALKGKYSFTFANIFFNKLKNCLKITLDDFRNIGSINELFDILKERNEEKLSIPEYSEYLYQRSYNGIVDAPVNSVDWHDQDNIKVVSESFNVFLNKFGTR
ncbi:hypothetical protein [Aestuariivivens insulae]|uniref:hypothetical protein n=1 Tax=Aestuariivivens insulae TaxID=1621988 RepID=UPI001F5A287E|nr:hypothetical protein [Aestuariivivens insulae]